MGLAAFNRMRRNMVEAKKVQEVKSELAESEKTVEQVEKEAVKEEAKASSKSRSKRS